ncbi:MAG TPA: zf-HC2 domain-containing protein, partial [Terriglobales bacterium]|nr:zf-HC2 domain-containing protein [Terriglobales bacterium]
MAELPKIVRERLSYQAVGEHPDANLLSAFVEHGLTQEERRGVLEHLSRCADCRQIVALTASEVTQERLVTAARAPAGAKPSWWRSPILHWGAFTAAALVMLIAVGARMRLREERSASAPAIATYSSNEVAQKSTTPAPEVSLPPVEQKQSSKKLASGPPPREPAVRTGKPGGVAGGTVGGIVGKGAAGSGSGAGAGVGNAPPPPAPAAPVAPQMKMQAKAAEVDSFRLDTGIDKSRQKATPAPPAAASETVEAAAAAPGGKSEAAVLSQSRDAMLTKRASLGSRWSVSGSGALQRSFDGGRSWKDVAVGDGVTFRAVATVGSDVWAGGSGGMLFHSADGGEHWSRVPMLADGRALSGDIVRIEFT